MPRERGVFSSTYTPQFASEKTTLLPIPPRWEAQPTAHVPSARREFKFPTPATPKQEAPALAAKLQSGPALADRLPSLPENPVVPLLASGSLDALTFLIGVDSSGNVAFLVPKHSSGDPAIDRDLIQLLRSLRFAPSEKVGLCGIFWNFTGVLGTRKRHDFNSYSMARFHRSHCFPCGDFLFGSAMKSRESVRRQKTERI